MFHYSGRGPDRRYAKQTYVMASATRRRGEAIVRLSMGVFGAVAGGKRPVQDTRGNGISGKSDILGYDRGMCGAFRLCSSAK